MKPELPNKFLDWEKETDDITDFKKTYVDIAGGNLVAGLVLSDIIYWYLPGKSGKSKLKVEKKGHYWIVRSAREWWDRIRIKEDRAKRALDKLEEKGLIEKMQYPYSNQRTTHIRLLEDKFIEEWEKVVSNNN